MIRLVQRKLILPRGDTGSLTIPVLPDFNTGDVAVFAIFNPLNKTIIFKKQVEIADNKITIQFSHNETVNLPAGKYLWDIKAYSNPEYADGELINGDQIDSYYAGYKLPECQIRETSDNYLLADDAPTSTLSPNQLDLLSAILAELRDAVQKSQENVTHYPRIINSFWYVWDTETKEYINTGVRSSGIIVEGSAEGSARTIDFSYQDNNILINATQIASGIGAFAEGVNTIAGGMGAHAQGYLTEVSGDNAHAEGSETKAAEKAAHAEGNNTEATGKNSHAEGYYAKAQGQTSHAEGNTTKASGKNSHAEGNMAIAEGENTHAEGYGTRAYTAYSHAEGLASITNGIASHAEGDHTLAAGSASHAEGKNTQAMGTCNHAQGNATLANGIFSHSQGDQTAAQGNRSHAEGYSNTSYGMSSHAEGYNTQTIGDYSHTEGYGTIAIGINQHVQGRYNIEDVSNTYADIIGIGLYDNNRKNGYTLDWSGNGWFAGRVSAENVEPTADKHLTSKKYVDTKLNLKADKTSIPTKVSDLIDDSGHYIKPQNGIPANDLASEITSAIDNKTDKVRYATSGNFAALDRYGNLIDSGHKHSDYLTEHQDISGKQDVLTFDDSPQMISDNPVKSSGIWNAINTAKTDLQGNLNILQGQVNMYAQDIMGLKVNKQNKLTFDSAPTANSTNPVTSGGVYEAITNIKTMGIYICTSQEYNSQTGIPTITSPDTKTFYLVPGGEGSNLYIEWIYINSAWEQFGSATIDLSGYALLTDIPSNISSFTNDVGYLTQHQDISGKQDVLTFDNVPTINSVNPVASNGIYTAIDNVIKIQETQPVDPNTKLWIHETGSQTVQVPTVSEVEDMIDNAGYLTQHQDISGKADKSDTVLNTTLSRGRKANTTVGEGSFAFGEEVTASGTLSHAEGYYTTASGGYSHAEGASAIAQGGSSHAEGADTRASGNVSHAEGTNTIASGMVSHTEGANTVASGNYSHAEGMNTIAAGNIQHVSGKYNIQDLNNKYAEIVGIGSYDNARANGRTLDWSGNAQYAGKVSVGNSTPTEDNDLTSKKYVDETIDQAISDSLIQGKYKTISNQNIVTFNDAPENVPLKDVIVNIEPIQDLHGYDNSWPGGSGKNKFGNYTTLNAYINSAGEIKASANDRAYVIACKPSTTYTFKALRSKIDGSDDVHGGTYSTIERPTINSIGTRFSGSNYSSTTNISTFSFTTGENDRWIVLKILNVTKTNEQATLDTVQLEEGSSVSDYSPYSNICPITGWTGAKLTRTGVNLWDEVWVPGTIQASSGINYDVSPTTIRSNTFCPCKGGCIYYTTYRYGTTAKYVRIFWYDRNKEYLGYGNIYSTTFYCATAPENAAYFRITIVGEAYGTVYNNDIAITVTNTTNYSPYSGTSTDISWSNEAGTVYGGTLNVTNGTLTVDKAMNHLDASTVWSKGGSQTTDGFNRFYCYTTPRMPRGYAQDGVCDKLPVGNGSSPIQCVVFGYSNDTVNVLSNSEDVTAFKAELTAMGGLDIVYPLAAPIVYTLTPQEITALLGLNHIWSNCGNTSVTYASNVKAYVDSIIPTKVSDLTDDSGHYTKPTTGIPASDLESGIIPTIITNSTTQEKAVIRAAIGAENGDDIIKVQDTQPTTEATKIWMPQTMPQGIQVPTVAQVDKKIAATMQDTNGIITNATGDWLEEHIDTSTGYVIDNTLTVTNAAADAKKTGDEISNLKSAIDDYNTLVYYKAALSSSTTSKSVTFAWNGSQCHVSGNTSGGGSGSANNVFYNEANKLPYGIQANGTYYVNYKSDHVTLKIYAYVSGSLVGTSLFSSKESGPVTFPANSTGGFFRLDAEWGVDIDETVEPIITNHEPQADYGQRIEDIEDDIDGIESDVGTLSGAFDDFTVLAYKSAEIADRVGFYSTANGGAFANSSDYLSTGLIRLPENRKTETVSVYAKIVINTVYRIAFFDSDCAFISGDNTASRAQFDDISIPATAVYFALSSNAADIASCEARFTLTKTLPDTVAQGVIDGLSTVVYKDQLVWINKAGVVASDGSVDYAAAGASATELVELPASRKATGAYICPRSTQASIAFYASDGTFISADRSDKEISFKNITIPSTAVYFRLSCSTAKIPKTEFRIYADKTDYAVKQSVSAKKTADDASADIQKKAGAVSIRQYDILECESFDGYYNASGTIVTTSGWKSYIVPIDKRHKYYFCNRNINFAALDSQKDFISILEKESVTNAINGDSGTITTYVSDISKMNGIEYICVPRNGTNLTYLRSGTEKDFIPLFPFNSDSTCDPAEISIIGDSVVYPAGDSLIGKVTENSQMDITTGEIASQTGIATSGFRMFKKGTTINAACTPLSMTIRGQTAGGAMVAEVNTGGTYTFTKDTWGVIDYAMTGSWKWSNFAPTELGLKEASIFLRVITPEKRAENHWAGKTWYCYGTSISDIGLGDTEGNNGHSGKYPLYLDAVSGMIRHNGAIGSGGIRTNASHGGNVLNALLQTPYDVDLVTLETLPNDGVDTPANVGDITDTGTTTICGAFKTACAYITGSTRAKFVLIFVNGNSSNVDAMGSFHTAYIGAKNKLKQIAEAYGVQVIDAEKTLDWAHRKQGILIADHIHPNYLGGEMFGRYIWERLKEIDINPDYPATSD